MAFKHISTVIREKNRGGRTVACICRQHLKRAPSELRKLPVVSEVSGENKVEVRR